MDTVTPAAAPADDDAAMATAFVKSLVSLYRAEDSYGAWERKSDKKLLEDFIVTKEERRAIPIISDPDPDTLDRVEKFYRAAGLAIEAQTGHMASPMMKMSHEGFGRVILTSGRLVVFSKSLRDVHRFGFESLAILARDGMKVVDQAVEMMKKFPEVIDA